jgi:hypothetical protein
MKAVLVEFEPTGEPSVEEVVKVPLPGRSLKLTVIVVARVEVTLRVLENEAEGDEVEFD